MLWSISEIMTQQIANSQETPPLQVLKFEIGLLEEAVFKTTIFQKKLSNKFMQNLGQFV